MLPIRRSGADRPNPQLTELARDLAPTNLAAIASASATTGVGATGDLILLGGSSLADFRVRVAQSHARHDMSPSYWSLVGILDEGATVVTVPLWPTADPAQVPASNAIQRLPLAGFDDPALYPNLAVVRFPGAVEPVTGVVERLRSQRSVIDLPSLLLAWLGFVWGAGDAPNPLLGDRGLPSAVLVETAFGIAQVELTPGLASASSCPEAIWQAAKWWHRFYLEAAGVLAPGSASDASGASGAGSAAAAAEPMGFYVVRQPEATYRPPAE